MHSGTLRMYKRARQNKFQLISANLSVSQVKYQHSMVERG